MDREGLIRAHGRLKNARILPKDMKSPVVLLRDQQLMILLLRQMRTVWLQESDAQSKMKVLDYWDQENGQGYRKQLCPLLNTAQKTEWQWNTHHASHQNGVIESLIKYVRQVLNSVCKNQAFIEEQWRTFLAEITYMHYYHALCPTIS